MIYQEFGIVSSGYALWREAVEQGAKFNSTDTWNDYSWISAQARAYRRQKESAELWWPPQTIPEKEKLDEVLSFLIENGIALHLRDFTSAKLTQKTNSLLLEKLKYELPLNTVIEAVKHYYGNFMEARDAFGLNKKKPVFDLSREQLLDIVKVVAREHPEASASSLRAGQSRMVGSTIEDNFGFYMSGEHFAKILYSEFGGYKKAKDLAEVK